MISQQAIAEIHKLQREGLTPTAEDIIRINAFGLAIETARGKRPCEDIFSLPRVAWLRDGVFFRQPSVGHEIWLDDVMRFVDRKDPQTVLAVNCFALSRPASELPRSTDPTNVKLAVDEYCARMADFTRDQLYLAVEYATYGFDHWRGETAAPRPRDENEPESLTADNADWESCIALGLLHRGAAVLLGLSLDDLRSMTREQLKEDIRAVASNYKLEFGDGIATAETNFYRTVDQIRERLVAERGETAATPKI